MLFSTPPKETKTDIFNYKEEYQRLIKGINDKHTSFIVITGLRRTGKTSLMKTAYNQTKIRKIYIDGREAGRTINEVSRTILSELSKDDFIAKIIGKLSAIEMKHFPVSIRIEFTKNEKRLVDVLSQVGEIIIFIDEAQRLKPTGLDRFLAYALDNLLDVTFVVSGSEIGVLDEFLGRKGTDTALYGRAMDTIHLHPLSKEKSIEFLGQGLKEIKKKVKKEELEKVVYQIDGIVGWLTMFGWFIYKDNSVDTAIKKTLEEGGNLIKKEFESFLSNRKRARKRYTNILKLVSKEPTTWTEIKEYLEMREKKEINGKQITKYLDNLIDYGFLIKKERKYMIIDPVLISVFKS